LLGGTVRSVGIGGGREYWEEYCSGMGTETASYWQQRAWPYGVYCMQARPTGAGLSCHSQLGSSSRQASRGHHSDWIIIVTVTVVGSTTMLLLAYPELYTTSLSTGMCSVAKPLCRCHYSFCAISLCPIGRVLANARGLLRYAIAVVVQTAKPLQLLVSP
jgi:hypothetical protein